MGQQQFSPNDGCLFVFFVALQTCTMQIGIPAPTLQEKACQDKGLYHSWQAGEVDKNSGETFQKKTSCNLSAPIPKHEAT